MQQPPPSQRYTRVLASSKWQLSSPASWPLTSYHRAFVGQAEKTKSAALHPWPPHSLAGGCTVASASQNVSPNVVPSGPAGGLQQDDLLTRMQFFVDDRSSAHAVEGVTVQDSKKRVRYVCMYGNVFCGVVCLVPFRNDQSRPTPKYILVDQR